MTVSANRSGWDHAAFHQGASSILHRANPGELAAQMDPEAAEIDCGAMPIFPPRAPATARRTPSSILPRSGWWPRKDRAPHAQHDRNELLEVEGLESDLRRPRAVELRIGAEVGMKATRERGKSLDPLRPVEEERLPVINT